MKMNMNKLIHEPAADIKRVIIALENAASIRVMGTDTLAGMKQIDADLEHRRKQVLAGLLTLPEAVKLIQQG